MNLRTLLIVGLAVLFGVSAAIGVSRRMQANGPAVVAVEMVPIVVAAVEMPRGTAVTSVMLTTDEWPKDKLPAGAITSTEDAVGCTVTIPLLKGEPLLDQKIAKAGFGRGVAPLVANGMRAFTVQTPTLTSGVGGLVLPGNKVDVLWTATTNKNRSDNDETGGGATVTLLQNIEILAADQQIGEEDAPVGKQVAANKELRSVTLQVTETDAKKLSLAQQKGTINLALRNGGDAESVNSPIVTLNDIRFAQGRPPERDQGVRAIPAPPVSLRVRIRTLHGRHPGHVQLELFGKAVIPEPLPPPVPEPGDAVAGGSVWDSKGELAASGGN